MWESRGRCGGPFVPIEGCARPRQDAQGYFFTALSLGTDASAPCFEGEERFYSCPVAMAGSEFVTTSFEWYHNLKHGRRDFLPDSLNAMVAEAASEIDALLTKRENYELEKVIKKHGTPES